MTLIFLWVSVGGGRMTYRRAESRAASPPEGELLTQRGDMSNLPRATGTHKTVGFQRCSPARLRGRRGC